MTTLELTKRVIDELPNTDRYSVLYHDKRQRGFGLRVSTNSKAYFVQKKVNGRTKRVTIGQHGVLTLDQARREATFLLADMTRGVDPNKVKREKKTEIITLAQAFESRINAKSGKLKPATVDNYEAMLDRHLSDWKNRSLEDITKAMIMQRYGDITRKHGPDAATKVIRIFSVTYNYARYLNSALPENPAIILSLTKSWHATKRRQRVIKQHHLPIWHQAVMGEENDVMRDFLLFLLFTGMRRGEASQLRWKDVDFDGNSITVHQTKNGHSHILPLGDYVKEMLRQRMKTRLNGYVFYGAGALGYMKDPKKAIKRVIELCGFPFSSHDIRRTFITTAESLDVSPYTIKYLINHRTNNDITGGYIVLDINRMREPMRRIEEKLLQLIEAENGNQKVQTATERLLQTA